MGSITRTQRSVFFSRQLLRSVPSCSQGWSSTIIASTWIFTAWTIPSMIGESFSLERRSSPYFWKQLSAWFILFPGISWSNGVRNTWKRTNSLWVISIRTNQVNIRRHHRLVSMPRQVQPAAAPVFLHHHRAALISLKPTYRSMWCLACRVTHLRLSRSLMRCLSFQCSSDCIWSAGSSCFILIWFVTRHLSPWAISIVFHSISRSSLNLTFNVDPPFAWQPSASPSSSLPVGQCARVITMLKQDTCRFSIPPGCSSSPSPRSVGSNELSRCRTDHRRLPRLWRYRAIDILWTG